MAQELQSMAVSAFCENMAMLLAAGIGPEEGTALLSDTGVVELTLDAAKAVHDHLTANGGTLADACAATGYFPGYACRMLAAGELTGRTEQVLRGLARYYADRARLNKQLRSAVAYPAVLLCLMAVILAVLLVQVLPVFSRVYCRPARPGAALSWRPRRRRSPRCAVSSASRRWRGMSGCWICTLPAVCPPRTRCALPPRS